MSNEIVRRGDAVTVTTATVELTQVFENDANNRPIYIGKAAPGTAKGVLKWQIQKHTITAGGITDIQWAEGSPEFKFEWDERAGYNYS